MIISDLNFVENITSEEAEVTGSGGYSYYHSSYKILTDKELDKIIEEKLAMVTKKLGVKLKKPGQIKKSHKVSRKAVYKNKH
jgi:hypothetical protein